MSFNFNNHCAFFLFSFFFGILTVISIVTGDSHSGPQEPPRISSAYLKPLQVVRSNGQEFRVTCPIEGSSHVDWLKDGELISSTWARYRINPKGLKIRNVLPEDSGIYKCIGVNGFGSRFARFRLVVESSPGDSDSIESVSGSGSGSASRKRQESKSYQSIPVFTTETLQQAGPMHLQSGNTIRFRCETKDPSSRVTWFKDRKAVGSQRWSSWTLILNKLESEDSGEYSCEANNTQNKAKTEFTIKLHVTDMVEKEKPELLWGYPNSTSVLSGKEAVLECVVKAGHTGLPPHIKWLKRVPENTQINSPTNKYNHRILLVENQVLLVIQATEDDAIQINETQKDGTFVSKLIFARVEPEFEGSYICLATNSIGFNFREARLTVLAGAEIMSNASSTIPFPLIVMGMSLIVGVVVIIAACSLRRQYQKDLLPKQTKSISPRQPPSPSIDYSASSMYRKQGFEQRQLLVSTSTHSSSSSSGRETNGAGHGAGAGTASGTGRSMSEHAGSKLMSSTTLSNSNPSGRHTGIAVSIPIPMTSSSHCSCCHMEKSISPSELHHYDQCFNNSYVNSTSHSICGHHWT